MSSTGMPSVMAMISRDAGVGRFHDGIGGGRRRHEDHGGVGPRLAHRLGHGVEQRKAFLDRAALARRDAADDLRAVIPALLGVEGAGLAEPCRGRGCICR